MILLHSKSDNYNLQASDVLSMVIFFGPATYGIKAIVSGLGLSQFVEQASLCIYILWFFIYLRFLWNNPKMIKPLFFSELIYLSILYTNIHFFPETKEHFEAYEKFIRQILVVYIPSIPVALSLNNFNGLLDSLSKIGKIGIVFMIVAYAMGFITYWDYQMFGIHISPFVMICAANYIKKRNFSNLLFFIVGVFFVLMGGRQSLVGIMLGVLMLYYINRYGNLSIKKTIQILLGVFIFVLLIILFAPFIIQLLISICEMVGVDSRTVSMLSGSELFDTSTRDYIYETSIYYIVNHGFQINGLMADKVFFGAHDSWIVYPHNLFLELMIDLGILLGGCVSVLIIYFFIKRLLLGSVEKRLFICTICTLTFARLLVSSSFITEGLFYTMIGLLLNCKDGIIYGSSALKKS